MLITAFTNTTAAAMVADSRLTWERSGGSTQRDVCQKVIRLGNDGLVGFAGDVKTAVKVLKGITGTYRLRGTSWLKSDAEIAGLLHYLDIFGAEPPAEFIAMFIDHEHLVLEDPPTPGALLVRFSTAGSDPPSRSYMGLMMTGSGSATLDDAYHDPGLGAFLKIGSLMPEVERWASLGLFLADVIATTTSRRGIDSVGGLFQIYLLMPSGLYAVPYERWIDIGDGMGTYVGMEINDEGIWEQVHAPSNIRIPLGFPFQDDFTLREAQLKLTFDMKDSLNKNSPGVIPATNPQLIYRPVGGVPHLHTP